MRSPQSWVTWESVALVPVSAWRLVLLGKNRVHRSPLGRAPQSWVTWESGALVPVSDEDKLIFQQRDNITDCMNKGGEALAGLPRTLSALGRLAGSAARPLGQKPRSPAP